MLQCTNVDVLKDLEGMQIEGWGQDQVKALIRWNEQSKVGTADNAKAHWVDKINYKLRCFGIQVSWVKFLNIQIRRQKW
jgi:hypothetical protein